MNEQPVINHGGLAPEHRQCRYTKSDGGRCAAWALHGRDHCFRHDRFSHALPERPLDIPLLEDEESVVYVLSQALQALAWGTLPVSNGRMILAGCRLAHTMHMQRLEEARFRFKVRRSGIPAHEIFAGHPGGAPGKAPAGRSGPPSHQPTAAGERPPEEPAALCPDPTPNPVKLRPKNLRFRDLKKKWDRELLRGQAEMEDMTFRRCGETKEDFQTARAMPFDYLAEVDREVERARALAAQADLSPAEACSPTC